MKLLNQLKALLSKSPPKVTAGLEKVTSQINKRTDGKYADKLEKVTNTVEGQLEKLTPKNIDLTDAPVDVTDAADSATDTAADQAADATEEITGS